LRIAIVNQPFDTVVAGEEQRGSVAIVNWELTRCLSPRHQITLWAAANKNQLSEESWGEVLIRRVPYSTRAVHKLIDLVNGRVGGRSYMEHAWFYRDYGLKVAQALAQEQYDVVFVSTISQYGPILRAALPKTRLVLHVHGDELDYFDREVTSGRLAAFDAVVTVSEFVSEALRRRFPEYRGPIVTIRNGVDATRFKPRSRQRDEATKRIMFVSRVSPDKGVHVLARAFDKLVQTRDDVELDVVGKAGFLGLGFMRMHFNDPLVAQLMDYYGRGPIGSLRKEVFGQRTSYIQSIQREISPQAAAKIRWRGTVSLDELVRMYATTDIFVLPSLWQETFGIPIVEAMASGAPVVASRSGGIPEIVVDGVTGRLVERGDATELFNVLNELLDDPERRLSMGEAGRTRVVAEYTWQHAAARLENLLLEQLQCRYAA